jgi:hypothetical protein
MRDRNFVMRLHLQAEVSRLQKAVQAKKLELTKVAGDETLQRCV